MAACPEVGQRLLLGSDPEHPWVPASSSRDTTEGVCFQSYLTAPRTVLQIKQLQPFGHSPPFAPSFERGGGIWTPSQCLPQRPASSRVSLAVLHSFPCTGLSLPGVIAKIRMACSECLHITGAQTSDTGLFVTQWPLCEDPCDTFLQELCSKETQRSERACRGGACV